MWNIVWANIMEFVETINTRMYSERIAEETPGSCTTIIYSLILAAANNNLDFFAPIITNVV